MRMHHAQVNRSIWNFGNLQTQDLCDLPTIAAIGTEQTRQAIDKINEPLHKFY